MSKIHHLNCLDMRPFNERLIHGHGSLLARGRMVCHCLLIETDGGLVLIDSGIGLLDVAEPERRLGKMFLRATQPLLDPEATAARQVERLGYARSDVRHVVLTHLDVDHAGGLPDFPDAEVHVLSDEHAAATKPRSWREKHRYRQVQWAHQPRWQLHEPTEGEAFEGFASVQAIVEPEVLLLPTSGHSRGHACVAVRDGDGWLLHCGDAYFHHGEMADRDPRCPTGLRLFQKTIAVDDAARRANQARLRQLRRERGHEIRLFCAHDGEELDTSG